MIEIKKASYSVSFDTDAHSLSVSGGHFGEMEIASAPLFLARAKRVIDGENLLFSSLNRWKSVEVKEDGDTYLFRFEGLCEITGISVEYRAEISDTGIYWKGSVSNESEEWSVMEISYPAVATAKDKYSLFIPYMCGMEIKDAGHSGFEYNQGNHRISMQFFAVYNELGGLYYAIHDPVHTQRKYTVDTRKGMAEIYVHHVSEGGNLAANSFELSGGAVWRVLFGDWYDAAKIYSEFVKKEAEWLPKIEDDGRPDTARKFKELPFWVCDYIPNSPEQLDNKPLSISAGSDSYEAGYWYKAVMKLQRELGTPIGYHTYNWHKIAFNVDYPHFLPAKEEYKMGLSEMRKQDIYVAPYINALSWETRDNFSEKFSVTFENTGKPWAVKLEDGSIRVETYPQTHGDGKSVLLAGMCPSCKGWHKIIRDVTAGIEKELPVDGIYFDQVSATSGRACYDESHNHRIGGGRFWRDGYKEMMTEIAKTKPKESFYFSEDNTEEFMDMFDGFLTWQWVMNEGVPAFPAVYAGYVQMLGRNTLGKKKDDVEFFKWSLAKSFVYGQQLGWIKADVVYSEEKLPFLKTLVRERYKHSDTFICSDMLRPPHVECSLAPKVTSPAMHYTNDVVMEQVCAGAWRNRANGKVVIFVINIAKEECDYTLSFDNCEYGIDGAALCDSRFTVDGTVATKRGRLAPESVMAFEF